MFIKHKILSIEISDIPQLFVATCYVRRTTTIAQKSNFFLHKHRFVLQRDFPVVLQPHRVKPCPSHNETLLTACLKESSFSLFIDPMSKNLLGQWRGR